MKPAATATLRHDFSSKKDFFRVKTDFYPAKTDFYPAKTDLYKKGLCGYFLSIQNQRI